jgi:ClpP class serine protease
MSDTPSIGVIHQKGVTMSDIDYVELLTNSQQALHAIESARNARYHGNHVAYLASLKHTISLYRDALRMIDDLVRQEQLDEVNNTSQSAGVLLAVHSSTH